MTRLNIRLKFASLSLISLIAVKTIVLSGSLWRIAMVQPHWLATPNTSTLQHEMFWLTYGGLPLLPLFFLFYGLIWLLAGRIVRSALLVIAVCTVVNMFFVGPLLGPIAPTLHWALWDGVRWLVGCVSFSAMILAFRQLSSYMKTMGEFDAAAADVTGLATSTTS